MFPWIVYHTVDINKDLHLTPLPPTSRSGNSKTFIRPHSNCNNIHTAFFLWSVNQWNRLPVDIVSIDDNLKFKATLHNHLIETGKWFKKNFSYHINIFYHKCLFIVYLLSYCIYIDMMH